jgi:peroxiredoxin
MKLDVSYSKSWMFFIFLLLVIAAVVLLEKTKTPPPLPPVQSELPPIQSPLPSVQMGLLALDVRARHSNFELPDFAGNVVRLYDLQGKVVLLNFFGTWCPPCRDEMPALEKLYQANKQSNFLIFGIAADPEGKAVVEPFVKKYGVTFPILLDPKKVAFQQYFVGKIPVTYLIDKQGRIAGMFPGAADWSNNRAQALIEQLLQES